MREYINFNENWYFSKTEICPNEIPSDWEPITLPHTWNAQDGQDGGNDYYRGTCMYAKVWTDFRKKKETRMILEFNGAAMTADVFLNGVKLTHHEGGYSTFRVDVTDYLQEDNLLCVAVDNGINDRVYPQKADFTFYGGLYREVRAILVPESHFELIKDGTLGLKVTPEIEGKDAIVHVETWQTGGDAVKISIGEQTIEVPCTKGYSEAKIKLERVHLWNGIKDPYLYTAEAELIQNGEIVDKVSARFGCRTYDFDKEKGFLLNGESYPLRGVSRHQDRKGGGNVLTSEMHKEDMEIIREIGANTIRLAHYQHAQEFYDLADEYGMIVWAEIPYITQHMPNGRDNTISQMRELVTQCYNHPSIICWGLSNEITASGEVTEDMLENHRLLHELCHRMDSTRPTTMAHVFMLETDSPMTKISDVGSYNLYFGWYLGELEQNDEFFDTYHSQYPERVIGFSEYGADANIQFQTEHPEAGDYSEQYQALYHEHILKCIEERPYLWSTYVWNLFDFAADGRDEGGAHGLNQKGLVSFDRKQKKDAFYLYKAYWSQEPFIHLCGKRYEDRTGDMTELKVYTNQPEVSLFVDGRFVECKKSEHIFKFQIPLTGEHTVEVTAGSYCDSMRIRKVLQPNPEYLFMKEDIVNWFDRDQIDPNYLSVQDTMGTVQSYPAGAAILGKLMEQAVASRGEVAQSTSGNKNLEKMMAGMRVCDLLKKAGDTISKDQLQALNDALQKIKRI